MPPHSLHRPPSTVHRIPLPRPLSSSPARSSLALCLWSPRSPCPRSPRARGPIVSSARRQSRSQMACIAFAVSPNRQGCAAHPSIHPTPRAGRGCLVMKSARRIRLSISRRVGLRRLCWLRSCPPGHSCFSALHVLCFCFFTRTLSSPTHPTCLLHDFLDSRPGPRFPANLASRRYLSIRQNGSRRCRLSGQAGRAGRAL